MNVIIRQANLSDPADASKTLQMLNSYARHPMGSGQDLPDDVQCKVIDGLKGTPTTRVFLAESDHAAVGIAICFVGYSTFKAKPLVNIHDLHVDERYARQGIGSQLIDAVVEYGRQIDGCAITLEVRRDNPARKLYTAKGFQTHGEPLPGDCMLFGKRML